MNKKTVLLITAIVIGAAAMPSAFAHGGEHWSGGECRGAMGGEDFTGQFYMKAHEVLESKDKLGLSKDQVDAVRKLKLDAKKEMIRQSAEGSIADLEIESQMRTDKPDAAAVQKLIDQKYEAEKTMSKAIADAYIKLKQTITDKQWETLESIDKEWMKGFQGENSAGQDSGKS